MVGGDFYSGSLLNLRSNIPEILFSFVFDYYFSSSSSSTDTSALLSFYLSTTVCLIFYNTSSVGRSTNKDAPKFINIIPVIAIIKPARPLLNN